MVAESESPICLCSGGPGGWGAGKPAAANYLQQGLLQLTCILYINDLRKPTDRGASTTYVTPRKPAEADPRRRPAVR